MTDPSSEASLSLQVLAFVRARLPAATGRRPSWAWVYDQHIYSHFRAAGFDTPAIAAALQQMRTANAIAELGGPGKWGPVS